MKTHKRKKVKVMRGKGMGTHGGGARKKRKKSGHHGGAGMSGSGKRADHKKTLITKIFGGTYFGKKGVTSRSTKVDKEEKINLGMIESNIGNYVRKGIAKKTKDGYEINLPKHKVLGGGEVKSKLIVTAKSASESAVEKVKEKGGEIILSKKKSEDKSEKSEDREE